MSKQLTKFDGIEAGRGIAATSVVLYHTARHLDKNGGAPDLMSLFQFGHAGVDFFFVLSGFIILFVHYPDIGQPSSLQRYGLRRLTRVVPLYWMALLLTIAMVAGGSRAMPLPSTLLSSALLLPVGEEPILGVAWTLQHEAVFYVLFAVLIWHRVAGTILLGAWLCANLAHGLGILLPAVRTPALSLFNIEFFVGMAAALLVRKARIPSPIPTMAAGVVLLVAAAIAENLGSIDGATSLAHAAYALPSGIFVLGAAEAGRSSGLRLPAVFLRLGAASYSIYLFQFIFIGVTWQLWLNAGLQNRIPQGAAFQGVAFIVLASAAIIGGMVVSHVIEHPLMALIRSRQKAGPQPALKG